MPRILRIINRFNLGGPTHNVAYLSKYLAPEFETMLIGGEHEEGEGSSMHILESMGLHPIIIPELKREINWKEDYKALKKIRTIISEFKPDIVHTHASKAGAVGRLAASLEKVPVIAHTYHGHVFHSYFGKIKSTFYLQTERYLAKKTNAIIAISEEQKKELVGKYRISSEDKFKVIHLGFDLKKFSENEEEKRKKFRESYGIEENEIVLMIIGRLTPIKNHRMFLELIRSIKNDNRVKIRGIIVGDGELKAEIMKTAEQLELIIQMKKESSNSDIIFTSWILETDQAVAGADVVCITSNNEGTPVSLIEAQAGGKPVLSTRVGGVTDIIYDGFGWVSEPGNLDEMKINFYRIINEYEKIRALKHVVRNSIRKEFHFETLTENMAQLYRQLLRENTE